MEKSAAEVNEEVSEKQMEKFVEWEIKNPGVKWVDKWLKIG